MRISSPPVRWPCFYGIDFATRAELIANGSSVEEIRDVDRRGLAGVRLARRTGRRDQPSGAESVPRLLHRQYPTNARPAHLLELGHAGRGDARGVGRQAALGSSRSASPDDTPRSRSLPRRRCGRGVSRTRRRHRPYVPRAGVDIEAGDRAVELMKASVAKATPARGDRRPRRLRRPVPLDTTRYRQPLLATSTDGVGTKLMIAQALDKHDTIGLDLVGMVVDDLVVCGAEPLFMTRLRRLRQGRARADGRHRRRHRRRVPASRLRADRRRDRRAPRACSEPDEYDLAGTGVGVVEADAVLGAIGSGAGDVVHRDGVERPALQRLLARPTRAALARAAAPGRRGRRARCARSARSCSSRPASTPRTASR